MIYITLLFLLLLPIGMYSEIEQNKNTSNSFAFVPMLSFYLISFFLFVGAAVQLLRLGYFYSISVPILAWAFMLLLIAVFSIPTATFLGIDVQPYYGYRGG